MHTIDPALKIVLTPPDEHVPRVPRRDVLLMLALVLVMVFVANAIAVGVLELHPRNRGNEITAEKWRLATTATAPATWLFIGDSSCNQGVIPETVTATAGGTALNLCTVGSNTVADDAWLLDAYVESAGAPTAVVLVHNWDMWLRGPETLLDSLWAIPGGPSVWQDRAPLLDLSVRESLTARFGRWLPLYTQNSSLLQAIQSPGGAPEIIFSPTGFMPLEAASEGKLARNLDEHLRRVRREEWFISDWNSTAFDALVAHTETLGVPLYLAMSPVHSELAADPNFAAWTDAFAAMYAERAAASPHVHVLTDRPFPVPPQFLEKADHVSEEGAEQYSRYLGELLSAVRP